MGTRLYLETFPDELLGSVGGGGWSEGLLDGVEDVLIVGRDDLAQTVIRWLHTVEDGDLITGDQTSLGEQQIISVTFFYLIYNLF